MDEYHLVLHTCSSYTRSNNQMANRFDDPKKGCPRRDVSWRTGGLIFEEVLLIFSLFLRV